MTSTFTTNLRLEKQADGENPNSWGTKINAVTDLVDEALTAYTTIVVSSAHVTLSENNGSSDQARSAFLELKGTLTTSINIVIPAKKKSYIVRNNATVSAGTGITVKTAAGTGVVVSATAVQMIICDSVSVHTLDAGVGLGTAANLNIGTSINELIPVSSADLRYVTVSAADTITGTKIFSGNAVLAPHVSLADAASIAVDLDTGTQFHVVLAGNRTLEAPTGSRTLGYNTVWKFAGGTAPTLTTAVSSVDMLVYSVRTSAEIDGFIVNDLKR